MIVIDPNSVDTVIYHASCTDGFGAAYAAWKCLGNKAQYYACAHGTEPPDVTGKVVAILDFSFNNSTTKKMIEDAQSQTKSNSAAARWLGVNYLTFRKYAKMLSLIHI